MLTIPSNEFVGSVYNGIITVTCFSGDTCDLDSPLGTHLATGTTTATYNENSLPIGYTILTGNDTTASVLGANAVVRNINVQHTVPIVLINPASANMAANTPLMIGINALKYITFESNTINNTVLYFANGTVAKSWIEGNALNEQANTNTLALRQMS